MKRVEFRRQGALLVGTESGDRGPQVLLLHAGGERRDVWQPVTERLAGSGYRCIAYDLRGHGESDSAGADELSTHAADVAAIIAAQPAPVTVVGASLGGLATLLALQEPKVAQKVSGLVLVDVVTHLDPVRVRTYLNSLRDGYGELPLVSDAINRREQLENSADALSALPTLLVRGESSALSSEECRLFFEKVPHATTTDIQGAGHLVARDAPQALAAAILEYLGSPAPRPAGSQGTRGNLRRPSTPTPSTSPDHQ